MDNQAWRLESFVDSLVVELDKTRETLAVKSINKPLTYSVKDMSLELQIFPTYDGDDVQFRTAQPGQQGASKLSLQLASITDQQVRATTQTPPRRDDVKLEAIPVDPRTRKQLRRLGVTSASDLEQIERRNVDLQKASEGAVDYKNLANLIRQARRGAHPPSITRASLSMSEGGPVLNLEGENLSIDGGHVPVAVLDHRLGDVTEHGPRRIAVRVPPEVVLGDTSHVVLTLDPYCIVRFAIRNPVTP